MYTIKLSLVIKCIKVIETLAHKCKKPCSHLHVQNKFNIPKGKNAKLRIWFSKCTSLATAFHLIKDMYEI